ncbi:LTA synthase family protein [Allobacillus sp. GCM10007491]|uniref:LTA synthase family protein n=1 Tax=Allobacillus saliphilus TaxID=2912308 RepID=A0A941HTX7_9BACI|nr:LTA synthase family protein [Allobacillus saliphilus]MBR7554377.1 LTA synthase family protein [Allobacillus saliphilus]
MNKIKQIPLFIIAAILLGVKTYIVYRFYFNLSIESIFQETILIINALAISAFILFLAVWMKPKNQKRYIKYVSLVMSLIVFANLLYYRNFTDFVTIPTLFQVNNAGDLGSSVFSLFYLTDILLFLDVILIFYFARKSTFPVKLYTGLFKRKLIVVSLAALALNLTLAEIERPMLFKRGFDREYLVKNVGIFAFHAYDMVLTASTQSKRLFADGSEMSEIEKYVDKEIRSTNKVTSTDMKGIAEDKNIIYIAAESLQSFVINKELHGEEITPFLNDLVEDSYYFDNFYHQTLLGKTSDHEFILDNSLYPLPNSAVYFTHAQNEFHSLPKIIKEKGYSSYSMHANNGSFWNRNTMYESLGYDKFFDQQSYEISDEHSFGWGLEDKEFFRQSVDMMKDLEEPYYLKMISLTNHFPFEIPEEKATIEQFDSNSTTLNQYFQTVRYFDESLEVFFDELKESGKYEDSIIIIMGDHYGISSYHNKAMAQFLGKDEITPYDEVLLERVPLLIHIPGNENNQVISQVTGQIDFKPTILNMLDIENQNDIVFGNDLFSEERKGFIAMRDGTVVGDEYIYTSELCYERSTGDIADDSNCTDIVEQAMQELKYSDEIIYGDLFRFYNFDKGEIIEEEVE